MSEATAIVVLTGQGLATARRVRKCLAGARIHGYAPRVADADVRFEDVGAELRRLFAADLDIVGVCAAGILARTLAPVLADKRDEPAVIAVAEDGSAVVPLLGGHRGANEIGRRLGEALGVPAAITTASEARWQVALDDPPPRMGAREPAALQVVHGPDAGRRTLPPGRGERGGWRIRGSGSRPTRRSRCG